MTLPDSTEPSALDPALWDEACRIYGCVGGVDPVSLTPQQREIIDRAYTALDRFRAAERERLQAIIHSLCPDAKNNWCRGGMLYGSDGKAMGACEWPGHIAGGHT